MSIFLGEIALRKEAFLREQSVKYTKLTKGFFFTCWKPFMKILFLIYFSGNLCRVEKAPRDEDGFAEHPDFCEQALALRVEHVQQYTSRGHGYQSFLSSLSAGTQKLKT